MLALVFILVNPINDQLSIPLQTYLNVLVRSCLQKFALLAIDQPTGGDQLTGAKWLGTSWLRVPIDCAGASWLWGDLLTGRVTSWLEGTSWLGGTNWLEGTSWFEGPVDCFVLWTGEFEIKRFEADKIIIDDWKIQVQLVRPNNWKKSYNCADCSNSSNQVLEMLSHLKRKSYVNNPKLN